MAQQEPNAAQRREIRIFGSVEELSRAGANQFIEWGMEAFQARGRFVVALAGGSTPRSLYLMLSSEEFRSRLDWSRVHFFWGDERAVPPFHADSNFRMARETLLSKVNPPPENIHRVLSEKSVPSEAGKAYAEELKRFFGLQEGEWPMFDLVLLGMGPDGHTASLFPGTAVVHETQSLVAVPWVEIIRAYRITLTPPVINHASHILFFVGGSDKAPALKAVLEGKYQPDKYPAQVIRPLRGTSTWMVDRTAAAQLTEV